MKWNEGRELSEDLKNVIEMLVSSEGMKEFDCSNCEEAFAASEESLKDGYCGICDEERKYEMRDSHGLENAED